MYSKGPEGPHYKIVSISLYPEDIELLEHKVNELRAQGIKDMNRSALLRLALRQVDVEIAGHDHPTLKKRLKGAKAA